MRKAMRKIRVLQFPIANSFGGITHYALNNWKWMNKDAFQCDFATMSSSLDFADDILASGSKIHYISCYAEENREQFIKEVNIILDEGYDVVHLHTKQWKSFLIEQICMEKKIPKVIVHSHNTRCCANDSVKREKETQEHYKVREQFNESLATDFWACSESAAEWLYGDRIPKNKICIMNNAIEIEKYLYNKSIRERLRKEYHLEDKVVIGNVGRLVYQKNQEFLIDVFASVRRKREDMRLVLVGDGELREDLQKQVKKLGIEEFVLFLGKRNDVNELYQMMDVFVLPSRFEGLPISLIEAQAAGLCCIASDLITKESNVAGGVQYIPLDILKWVEMLKDKYIDDYRKNMYEKIAQAGFDLKEQIDYLSKKYAEGLDKF